MTGKRGLPPATAMNHLSGFAWLRLHPNLAVAQGLIQRETHYPRELLSPLGTRDCCPAYSYNLAKAFLRETKGLTEAFQFTSGHYGQQVGLLGLVGVVDCFLLRARISINPNGLATETKII
jgi:hypothetical protein